MKEIENQEFELDYKLIGRRIQKERLRAKMTQDELAEAANFSKGHLGHIETGTANVGLKTLIRIANALHVTVDILLQDVVHTNDLFSGAIMTLLDKFTDEQKDVAYHILAYLYEFTNKTTDESAPED